MARNFFFQCSLINRKFERKHLFEIEIICYILSHLIKCMHPCWIKVLIFFKKYTEPKQWSIWIKNVQPLKGNWSKNIDDSCCTTHFCPFIKCSQEWDHLQQARRYQIVFIDVDAQYFRIYFPLFLCRILVWTAQVHYKEILTVFEYLYNAFYIQAS